MRKPMFDMHPVVRPARSGRSRLGRRPVYGLSVALAGLISLPALGQPQRKQNAPSEDAVDPSELRATAEDLPPPSAGVLLLEKSRRLEAKEAELDEERKDLDAAKKRLEAKIAQLEAFIEKKRKIERGEIDAAEAAKRARLAELTELTSKMPPERAAPYLSALELETAAQIVRGMKSRQAAAVMAELPASKAAEIGRKYLESVDPKAPSQRPR